MLADGIVVESGHWPQLDGAREWALRHGLSGSSVKGEAWLTGTTRKSGKPYCK